MFGTPRRSLGALLPWLALAVVTGFAFTQVRARRAAEQRSLAPAPPPGVEPRPAEAAQAASRAAGRLDAALAAAALETDLARAQSRADARAAEEARARAEAESARRALAQARLEALVAEVERLRQEVAEAHRAAQAAASAQAPEVEALKARLAQAEGARAVESAAQLAREAAGEDAAVRAQALARARGGAQALLETLSTPAALAALATPEDARGVLRLLPELPSGPARTALALWALRLAPGGLARTPALLQALRQDAPALVAVLAQAPAPARLSALQALGPDGEPLTTEQRAELWAGLLKAQAPGADPVLLRTIGRLRLAPGEPLAVAALADSDAPARAAAAWALSRLGPLSASSRGPAARAAVALLAAPSLEERTAGLLLAEALLGERLAFDPSGAAAARQEALARIAPRLATPGR